MKRRGWAARSRRQAEADARLERNLVIDCTCGNRHARDWPGCNLRRTNYAQGGVIPGSGGRTDDSIPIVIDPGYILVDADTYDRVGPEVLRDLNNAPNAEIEIFLTAEQAKARHGIELEETDRG